MNEENFYINKLKEAENPFKVPDGYFEESRARIMDAISKEGIEKPVKVGRLKSRLLWVSGIAASLLIGLMLFQNLYIKPQQEIKMTQEIEWFVNYASLELNSGLLSSYVADEKINIDEFSDNTGASEQLNLLEITEFDELYIIEEWMNSENQ
jgi:hypothetical protein